MRKPKSPSFLNYIMERIDFYRKLGNEQRADRWIGDYPNMSVKAVEFDKKGRPTKYKANWYVEKTIKQEI